MENNSSTLQAMNILVVGASGYVGRHLVPKLLQQGHKVRVSARRVTELVALFDQRPVDICPMDLLQPTTVTEACRDIDIAFYLVHSMQAGDDFAERDRRAAHVFGREASRAGIKQIVYLGALAPEDTHSLHLRSRAETGEALREGGVPVTELRAPIIVGAGSVPFEAIRDMVNHLPGMLLPTAVKNKSAPIALDNLLFYLVGVMACREAYQQIYDVAGPDTISYLQQIEKYAAVTEQRFKPLPFFLISIAMVRFGMPLFSSAPKGVIKALLGGLKHDILADDKAIRRLLPQPLLSYEQAVEKALADEQSWPAPLTWFQGNMAFREGWRNAAFYGDCLGLSHESAMPAKPIWQVLSKIGGKQRFFFMNWVWAIREWIDFCVGGPGRDLGRDTADKFVVGERVDSWNILRVNEEKSVLLGFGMKGPGSGNLEFRLEPLPDGGTRITMLAYWHPAGFWGQLYWYSMMRPHTFLFWGMLRRISALAVKQHLRSSPD
ncbi:DUF2867 domain-containing protein [Corallincola holothuriorum]|uniref:DUF2867 domain-containing protein n=1 Tax=Corallincola holothuriorum TaxID=2282215 RepID=A0A368NNF8_9GAMM|nr:DUF2867 domain-containing protein [Corallincola holothuriorum]RCU51696.1 DUF2867 domain-containing protein [Corallincola holothuriorum]